MSIKSLIIVAFLLPTTLISHAEGIFEGNECRGSEPIAGPINEYLCPWHQNAGGPGEGYDLRHQIAPYVCDSPIWIGQAGTQSRMVINFPRIEHEEDEYDEHPCWSAISMMKINLPLGITITGGETLHAPSWIPIDFSVSGTIAEAEILTDVSINITLSDRYWMAFNVNVPEGIPPGDYELPYTVDLWKWFSTPSYSQLWMEDYFVNSHFMIRITDKPKPEETTQGCDLIVQTSTQLQRDYPVEKETDIEVIVRNIGESNCPPCEVELSAWTAQEGIMLDTQYEDENEKAEYVTLKVKDVPALSPGQSHDVKFERVTSKKHSYWDMRVMVDHSFRVDESNEWNNWAKWYQTIGWYDPVKLSGYAWPTEHKIVTSVLNEPRATTTRLGVPISTRFHNGTDFGLPRTESAKRLVKSMTSGKILYYRSLPDDFYKGYLETTTIGYLHFKDLDKYNYNGIRDVGRWVISSGQRLGMNPQNEGRAGEQNHVHINDYTHGLWLDRTEPISDIQNMACVSSLRDRGVKGYNYDNYPATFFGNTIDEQVHFYVRGSELDRYGRIGEIGGRLDPNNLHGEIEIVAYVIDDYWGIRRGIEKIQYEIVDHSGFSRYISDLIDLSSKGIRNDNYYNLYNTDEVKNSRLPQQDHKNGYFGIILTSEITVNDPGVPRTVARSFINIEDIFDALDPNDDYYFVVHAWDYEQNSSTPSIPIPISLGSE